ncbi:MAG: glycosyltransferase family 2 protein [Actinomycetes bacterium]
MKPLAIVVPTLDEESHIARCLSSVHGLGDLVVVDSGSTDGTVHLAESLGARVVHQDWLGYAAQKNFALELLEHEYEWVLLLDADEVVSADVARGVAAVAAAGPGQGPAAYRIARRNYFLGRELRHCWWYPDYQIRLVQPRTARFEERSVHEHLVIAGEVATLPGDLHHENLNGLSAFLSRHNRYSTLEALEIVRSGDAEAARSAARDLLDTRTRARRWVKERLWYRLPARPLIRFLWLYVVRRGFLDGRAGFIYCCLIAFYDAETNFKVYEHDRQGRSALPDRAPGGLQAASRGRRGRHPSADPPEDRAGLGRVR